MTLNQMIVFAVCCGWHILRSPQSVAAGVDLAFGMKIDVKLWISCGRLIEEIKSFAACKRFTTLELFPEQERLECLICTNTN